MEVGQVWVFFLDDVGDEVKQRLRAVSGLGLQQLKSEDVDNVDLVVKVLSDLCLTAVSCVNYRIM